MDVSTRSASFTAFKPSMVSLLSSDRFTCLEDKPYVTVIKLDSSCPVGDLSSPQPKKLIIITVHTVMKRIRLFCETMNILYASSKSYLYVFFDDIVIEYV